MKEISDSEVRLAALKTATLPLIKYLAENYHPHVIAIVTGTSIEVLEGSMSLPQINDFIVD